MFLHDSDPDHSRRRFTRRAVLLGGLQGLGFALLAGRLYQLQVMDGRLYAPLAEDNRITTQVLAPTRGRIFDRSGRPLADNAEIYQAQVIPALTANMEQVLAAFAQIIPLSPDRRAEMIAAAKSQSRHTPVILATNLTWQQLARINLHAPNLPGVDTLIVGRRRYHGGTAMGHVVGYTGAVERFALDDDPAMRLPGIAIGKSGLEAGLDAALHGEAGLVRREVDARGRVIRELERRDPRPGKDVFVTIDSEVQGAIRHRLKDFRRAAATVVDVQTGEIAAMVSVPGYDPAPFAEGITTQQWRALTQSRDDPLIDRTLQGQYPPGSTFKMVTALAGLEAGVIKPDERIDCAGAIELAGQQFRCWHRSGHGPCDLHRGLRESCDVYFYELARRVGISRIAACGQILGLGQTFDIGLGAQKAGLLPDPEWKRGALGRPWYDGETLLAGIGQGYVLATPLQLAVMMARLATGRIVSPSLVRFGEEPVRAFPSLALQDAHLEAMRRAMLAVVYERSGTGRQAFPGVEGVTIMGKTGTSQVTRLSGFRQHDELQWHHRDHALFVGCISDKRPRYAASLIVEHGGSGGQTAAPLVRDILLDVYRADPAARPVATGKRGGA
jgi:penicillin-binding protein 2